LPGPESVCKISNFCWYETWPSFDLEKCGCPYTSCDFTIYEKTFSYAKFPGRHYSNLLNRSHLISYLPLPEFVISTIKGENDTDIPYLNDNFTESFMINNYAKIRIYYDALISGSMEEYLEYSTPQFIIDFLGYIGLFTGAGFLTFFEIIELCFGIIKPADDY